jgi:hypothetical protein
MWYRLRLSPTGKRGVQSTDGVSEEEAAEELLRWKRFFNWCSIRGRLDKVYDLGIDLKQCGTGAGCVRRANEGFKAQRESQRNSDGGAEELHHDSVACHDKAIHKFKVMYYQMRNMLITIKTYFSKCQRILICAWALSNIFPAFPILTWHSWTYLAMFGRFSKCPLLTKWQLQTHLQRARPANCKVKSFCTILRHTISPIFFIPEQWCRFGWTCSCWRYIVWSKLRLLWWLMCWCTASALFIESWVRVIDGFNYSAVLDLTI